jgi:phage replication O-like protein O
MANPQKENGYTPIANEILEHLVKIPLLGSEFQVLFFIIRKTYGYHKKDDRISLTQFEKGTGLSRPTVVKTLKNLMARNMVVKIYLPDENKGYSFVKDHEKWVVKTHLLVKGKWQTSKDVLTETSKDVLTHKRKKDNTKDNTEQSSGDINLLIKEFEFKYIKMMI